MNVQALHFLYLFPHFDLVKIKNKSRPWRLNVKDLKKIILLFDNNQLIEEGRI